MKYFCYYESLIGRLTMVSDGDKLIALKGDSHRFYDRFCDGEIMNDSLDVFVQTRMWLDKYFNGEKPNINDISIYLSGSDFRIEVWKMLCEIPYGSVVTYKEIAMKIALKKGLKGIPSQAVGNAVGHNPISIIIPCHRVVGTNGSLTGYGGGINNKIKLLQLEDVDMSRLYIPKKGNAL